MRKIPPELREEMANDPFYKKCCVPNLNCTGKIEWHHNLIYAGSQVNEKFCILPVCKYHHDNLISVMGKLNWIMLNRATDEELLRYSKARNYLELRKALNIVYGNRFNS